MNPLNYLTIAPREIMARHAKTFTFAASVLSTQQLEPICRLYQLCRVIDDCADEMMPDEGRHWLENFRQAAADGTGTFGQTVRELEIRGVERRYLIALLEGALFDLHGKAIETDEDLLRYCYLVAGVVGLMMCPLLCVRDREALDYARDLGIAMQLTNICRDVYTDAKMGRFYLPGLNLLNLATTPVDLKASLRRWLDEADTFYESAYRGLSYLPLRARICILIAGQVYRAIGNKIRRVRYEVRSQRIALTKIEKIVVAGLAIGRAFRPSFWIKPSMRKKLRSDDFLRGVEALYG